MDGLIYWNAQDDEWEIGWVVVGVGDAAGGPYRQGGRGLGALQRALVQAAVDAGHDVPYALRKERSVGWRFGTKDRPCGLGESSKKN